MIENEPPGMTNDQNQNRNQSKHKAFLRLLSLVCKMRPLFAKMLWFPIILLCFPIISSLKHNDRNQNRNHAKHKAESIKEQSRVVVKNPLEQLGKCCIPRVAMFRRASVSRPWIPGAGGYGGGEVAGGVTAGACVMYWWDLQRPC